MEWERYRAGLYAGDGGYVVGKIASGEWAVEDYHGAVLQTFGRCRDAKRYAERDAELVTRLQGENAESWLHLMSQRETTRRFQEVQRA